MILSPHLDDAAISAYSLIARHEPVLNVFAGIPPDGTLSLWDRLTGATCSGARARERREEDGRALSLYGIVPTNLDYLDGLNRPSGTDPSPDAVALALSAYLDGTETLYAPLGGGPKPHRDHEIVRDAARLLAARDGHQLVLYADQPYCYKNRWWPPFVLCQGTTEDIEESCNAPLARWWAKIAKRAGLTGFVEECVVKQVDAGAKIALMKAYETQYEALNTKLRTHDLLRDPVLYGLEVFWTIDKGR